MTAVAGCRTIGGMRTRALWGGASGRWPVVLAVAAVGVVMLGGCGQKPHAHPGAGAAPSGDAQPEPASTVVPLPRECEGDAEHCIILASYQGVNVYRNVGPGGFCSADGRCRHPKNAHGARWQCVELFNRFFALRFGIRPVPGDARDLLDNAAGVGGLEVRPNGGDRRPVPGDALVFSNAGAGHVAIIVGVDDNHVQVVEQNVAGDGTSRYRYDAVDNRVLPAPGGTTALGWLHAKANEPRPDGDGAAGVALAGRSRSMALETSSGILPLLVFAAVASDGAMWFLRALYRNMTGAVTRPPARRRARRTPGGCP